jgi:hypothetical protein
MLREDRVAGRGWNPRPASEDRGRHIAAPLSPQPSDRVEADALPFAAGEPPWDAWATLRRPPDPLLFYRATPTLHGWVASCPACVAAWVLLVPSRDGTDYEVAIEDGCSGGCDPALVAWWASWRAAVLPSRELREPPDERARRYAAACIRRILAELPDRPTLAELRRAAFLTGSWCEAGGLPADAAAAALARAATRAGIANAVEALALALAAGRAKPGRGPHDDR